MKKEELNEYILHYFEKDKTNTALMLSGEWGTGKTYYIENELMPFLKNKNVFTVSVSLYGLDDVASISRSIYLELKYRKFVNMNPAFNVKGQIIAKNIIKNMANAHGISLELSDKDLNKLYKSVNLKNKLIVLEDVERSNMDIVDVLGFVNGLVESDGVKVLLVANENEILKKETPKIKSLFISEKEEKNDADVNSEDLNTVKKYLRIKEKTVRDTIQFDSDYDVAVEQILSNLNNAKINELIDQDQRLYKNISNIVKYECGKNLRTYKYALQKTTDIIELIGENDYDNDFFCCLLLSILHFSAKIKADDFPKWDGDEHLSFSLGSFEYPLMRFAYDYVRYQRFSMSSVEEVYTDYKKFKLFESDSANSDSDVMILTDFYERTEEDVIKALGNIEKKLGKVDALGIKIYYRLAYYIIYAGSIVGFDYNNSLNSMIDNTLKLRGSLEFDEHVLLSKMYSLKDKKLDEIYNAFVKQMATAINDDKKFLFSYSPTEINNLYQYVRENKKQYLDKHVFLGEFDQYKIIEMLEKSSSKEIEQFRDVLHSIYQNSWKNDFNEQDIEAMNLLMRLIDEKVTGEHNWDKIQLLQLQWLKSNLNSFIEQIN